jgi:hypothetical protein
MDSRRNSSNNKVRTGFRYQDEIYLKKYDNPAADPDKQIFSLEEPESKQYWCAICRSRLEYRKNLEIFICTECFEQYDPKIQDTPIANNSKYKITPHNEIWRYPKCGEDDPNIPFVKAISLDEQLENSNIEILRQSDDGRVKHIRITENCTREEALQWTRGV